MRHRLPATLKPDAKERHLLHGHSFSLRHELLHGPLGQFVGRNFRLRGTGGLLLSQLYARAWVPSHYPSRVVDTDDDLRFWVDTNSKLEWHIYVFGAYDPLVVDALRSVLESGHKAIDVGANIGSNSLVMADAVGSKGQIIAIEPVPNLQSKILANVELNRLSNVELVPAAASDRSGMLDLFLPKENAPNKAQSSVIHHKHLGDRISVECTSVDQIVEDSNWTSLRLIKIDVEGHEPAVLDGSCRSLEEFAPYVLFEFEPDYMHSPTPWSDVQSRFPKSKGYKFYELRAKSKRALLPATGPRTRCNVLAVPENSD